MLAAVAEVIAMTESRDSEIDEVVIIANVDYPVDDKDLVTTELTDDISEELEVDIEGPENDNSVFDNVWEDEILVL
ncbi:hypothetical protein Trydic_g19140 [Trypoxylus dichotomus]